MTPKNKTRFRSLDKFNEDPRVREIFDEGEDGIWMWVAPGFTADPRDAHDIHEWKVRDILRRARSIVPCDCPECLLSVRKVDVLPNRDEADEAARCAFGCGRPASSESDYCSTVCGIDAARS